MKHNRKLELKQRDTLIAEDYRTMTLAEIGKKYHMTYQNAFVRIKKMTAKNNLDFTEIVKYRRMHPRVPCAHWSKAEAQEKGNKIINDYKKGVSVKELAYAYQLSPTTIYERLHRQGIMHSFKQ